MEEDFINTSTTTGGSSTTQKRLIQKGFLLSKGFKHGVLKT